MKASLVLLLSLLLAVTYPALAAPLKPIRLAATEWPPYTGRELPHKGLAAEIVTAAFARVGYRAEFAIYPWLRAQTLVKAGTLDGMGIAWYTPERATTMTYSSPYLLTDIVLIKHRDDSTEYQDSRDLVGKRFGVLRGYGYMDLIASDSIQKTVVDQLQQSLFMLSQKRVDLTLEERLNAHHILKSLPAETRALVSFVSKPLQTKELHITISKNLRDHQEIIEAFNRGLRQIIDDGSYSRIVGAHEPPPSGITD